MFNAETVAAIIDMPQEDFEKQVSDENLSIGQISNLTVFLEGVYAQLIHMKDGVMNLVMSGEREKDDPEIVKNLTGIYAELTKIELKVVFLKNRRKEIVSMTEKSHS